MPEDLVTGRAYVAALGEVGSGIEANAQHLAVAGVDEAGRGPLAGPVVAAAVRFADDVDPPEGLNDSKKLSSTRREQLSVAVHASADVGVGIVSVEDIDRINILMATMEAMCRAVIQLSSTPDFVLIDGNRVPVALSRPSAAVIKGDGKVREIAAASIVAKVTRDRIMADLASQFPGYGWETNQGYGTAAHLTALQSLGVTPHHRRSFAPVRAALG